MYAQARSEVASCARQFESSPMEPKEEERIRTDSWVLVAGEKKRLDLWDWSGYSYQTCG